MSDPPDYSTFGKRLAGALQARRVSRRELAAELRSPDGTMGVSVAAIGQALKDGKLSAENSVRAARFLNVDAYWLATGEGDPCMGRETPSPTEWDMIHELREMSEDDIKFLRQEAHDRAERWRKMRDEVLAKFGANGAADPAKVQKALGNVPKLPLDGARKEKKNANFDLGKKPPAAGKKASK